MPAITVKNIPDELYEKLKEAASTHHRSVNSELIHCLEQTLLPKRIDTSELLRKARSLRDGINTIDPTEIENAIDRGRP